MLVTSTKGKLEVLKTHYRHLGSCSVDSAFDDSWKKEVDEQVSECSSVSKACEDSDYIGLHPLYSPTSKKRRLMSQRSYSTLRLPNISIGQKVAITTLRF